MQGPPPDSLSGAAAGMIGARPAPAPSPLPPPSAPQVQTPAPHGPRPSGSFGRLVAVNRSGQDGEVFPVRHDVVDIGRSEGDLVFASDRYLAPGATLDDLKTGDGATGYASALKHGVTGEGMNDYDAIFRILSSVAFGGWISIEDGMDGLGEIARSA